LPWAVLSRALLLSAPLSCAPPLSVTIERYH
jgi:hypothetical protein